MEKNLDWNDGGPAAYSESEIASAIEAGILPLETAVQLRRHVTELRHAATGDEEYFRLISGFNDIFVVITCSLLLVAVGGLYGTADVWKGALAVAVCSWLFAEYFVRKRRMALTAIVLLLAFVGSLTTLGKAIRIPGVDSFTVCAVCALLAALLHWKRFKVPITVACGAGAAVALSISLLVPVLLLAFPHLREASLITLIGIGGMLVFALALKWDSLDPARQSRHADIAFWLHLLAAPMLVHPLLYYIGIFTSGPLSPGKALTVVVIYIGIAFVSLCIDRRALMVSSLGYVVYALSELFNDYGQISRNILMAALVISALLLLLASKWQWARAKVVPWLPHAMQRRLPVIRL